MNKNHLFLKNSSSEILVIIFSGIGYKDNSFDFYNCANKLSEKYNVLLLNNGENRWYLDGIPSLGNNFENTIEAIRAWISQNNINKIFCIGTSMGGFGALYYGITLRAENILAFNCETKLRIPAGRSLKGLKKPTSNKTLDILPLAKDYNGKMTLIFGEMDVVDYFSATRLVNLPCVNLFSLSGVTHYTARHIKTYSNFESYIDTFIQSGELPQVIGLNRYVNHNEGKILYKIYLKFLKKQYEDVIADISAYKRLKHTNSSTYLQAISYFRLKNYKVALENFSLLSSMMPWYTTARRYQAICLRRLGKIDEAISLLEFSLYLNNLDHAACCEIGITYFYKGKNYFQIGKMWLQRALTLAPNNKRYLAEFKRWNDKFHD